MLGDCYLLHLHTDRVRFGGLLYCSRSLDSHGLVQMSKFQYDLGQFCYFIGRISEAGSRLVFF